MPFKIHLRIFEIGAALLAILPLSANAWTNHAYLTTPALGGQPEYREVVSAEPLDSFLSKEKLKIGDLLKAEEAWAVANVRAYPAAPQTLEFLSSKETNLRIRFLKALRVNPDLELPLFVMILPGSPVPQNKRLPKAAVSTLTRDFQNNIYIRLEPGEKISALEVLSSASDEPDYGLDIGLWENNDTKFGKEYGYGKQPFGNPKLDYGTQAPFHMGFYHESGLIYAAAASFKKTFPEQRVAPVPFPGQIGLSNRPSLLGIPVCRMGFALFAGYDHALSYHYDARPKHDHHAFHSHIGYDRHPWTHVTGRWRSVQGPHPDREITLPGIP